MNKTNQIDDSAVNAGLSRRNFIKTTAAVGAGALLSSPSFSFAKDDDARDVNVAIVGTGSQGRVLLNACKEIPGLKFKAVCDVWKYNQRYGEGTLRKFGHKPNPYFDYKEMLEKEKDLEAVIVATPDFMHAPITVDALQAGKHVYCEKLMSNSIEGAKEMVLAARETGKLLQIGHQRRSNPRYLHAFDNLLKDAKLLGRITNANGQWNRGVKEDLDWPKKYEMSKEELAKWGYDSMSEFRNWRVYKKYGGGPISDLGAHQIDVFNWFLQSNPVSVMAGGGVDFYKHHEHYDNVMAIYEYMGAEGVTRAFYQVLTTTSAGGGYNEYFMGTEGALKMSENDKWTKAFREAAAPEWDEWVKRKYVEKAVADKPKEKEEAKKKESKVDVRESAELVAWKLPVKLDKPIHQPHLENFFDAIRKGTPLNCPADVAYESTVTVLKVNEAVAAGKKLEFNPEEFVVS